jgi:hypothetical protein
MRYGTLSLALLVLSIAGCANARLVNTTASGGCVAIPSNSDTWPAYNRRHAMELIAKQCPTGYTIVREEEVVTGQTTTNSTQTDTKQVPLMKGVAMDVRQTTQNTASVHDQTEWRIWYERK